MGRPPKVRCTLRTRTRIVTSQDGRLARKSLRNDVHWPAALIMSRHPGRGASFEAAENSKVEGSDEVRQARESSTASKCSTRSGTGNPKTTGEQKGLRCQGDPGRWNAMSIISELSESRSDYHIREEPKYGRGVSRKGNLGSGALERFCLTCRSGEEQ